MTGAAGPDKWAAALRELTPITSANATLAVLQHALYGIGEDDLDRSTPCTEFTVTQLEAHLLSSLSSLTGVAGSTLVPTTASEIESRIAAAGQQAVEIWTKRGLEGTVQAGTQKLPTTIAASILSVEFLGHAWDFASATGHCRSAVEPVRAPRAGRADVTRARSSQAKSRTKPARLESILMAWPGEPLRS